MLQETDLKIGTCINLVSEDWMHEAVILEINNLRNCETGQNYLCYKILVFNRLETSFATDLECEFQFHTTIEKYSLDELNQKGFELAYIPHFCHMKNLHSVLSRYTNLDRIRRMSFTQYYGSDYYESWEEDKRMAVINFQTHDDKYLEIVIHNSNNINYQYKSPYVWVNLFDNTDELSLSSRGNVMGALMDGDHFRIEELSKDTWNSNYNLNIFRIEKKEHLSDIEGLGIIEDGEAKAIVFKFDNEEEDRYYGFGVDISERLEALIYYQPHSIRFFLETGIIRG